MSPKNHRKAIRKLARKKIVHAGYEALFHILTMDDAELKDDSGAAKNRPMRVIDENADHLRFLFSKWIGDLTTEEIDHYYSNHGFSDKPDDMFIDE